MRCSAVAGAPAAEVCNGVDDDCDGTVDDIPDAGCLLTLVGSGPPGFADGDGGQARFASPKFLSVDRAGTLYVADWNNHAVRRIDSLGNVSTVAGDGHCGWLDGPTRTAELCNPHDVQLAPDESGLFVTEDWGRLRFIAFDGGVRTLAGIDAGPAVDGPLARVRFGTLGGMFVLPNGDVDIADTSNNRVRRFLAAAQQVITVAGNGDAGNDNGSALNMSLNQPVAVLELNGDLLVSEAGGNRIRLIPLDGGNSLVFAGAVDGGAGFDVDGGVFARFNAPQQLARTQTSLLVADSHNDCIRGVSGTEGPSDAGVIAGNCEVPGLLNGRSTGRSRMMDPQGLAWLGGSPLALVFSDGSHRIRQVVPVGGGRADVDDLAGGVQSLYGLNGEILGASAAQIFPDGGLIWVETVTEVVRKTTADGGMTVVAGTLPAPGLLFVSGFRDSCTCSTDPLGLLSSPTDIKLGSRGRAYVADSANAQVRVIDLNAGTMTTLDAGNLLRAPTWLAVTTALDGSDVVYVSDVATNTVRALTPGGVDTVAVPGGLTIAGPIAADNAGALYVVDNRSPRRMIKIDRDGGSAVVSSTSLAINVINAVAATSDGKLVVAESRRLLEVTFTDGGVRTIFGGLAEGWQDGTGDWFGVPPSPALGFSAGVGAFTGVSIGAHSLIVTDQGAGRIKRLWGYPP